MHTVYEHSFFQYPLMSEILKRVQGDMIVIPNFVQALIDIPHIRHVVVCIVFRSMLIL